ncbi:phage major capsid protein [Croceicoccus sp. Ery15]|uniref:phage major capsid protein n=1 Tax=Croceicoccus sp. Ery15 TaxID=1703338 RepID=UPI001E28E310|nr:phage major capsid protein [Croceicoccus sp. Ery15]
MNIETKLRDAKTVGEVAEAIKSGVLSVEEAVRTLSARMDEAEQKGVRHGGDFNGGGDSWGHEFTREVGHEVKGLMQNRGHIGLELKTTITSATGDSLIVPKREQIVGLPKRRLTIRSLMTTVNVSTGSVEYPQLTARTNAAEMVAEGTLKPESALTFDLATAPIRTIAHWIPASVQVLEDVPQLQSLIDEELTYGVALKEEAQLLAGDGTGQNLDGMVTNATAFSDPMSLASPNMIDMIGAAILQCSLTDVPPDGIVIHPSDWWRMRLLKDGDGKYILGDPGANVTPMLFGLPVVPTQAQTVDKFLVGSFKSQTLYDRHRTRIEISTEHDDFFTRNLVAIRGEERIGMAVKRPEALIYGDFGNVA